MHSLKDNIEVIFQSSFIYISVHLHKKKNCPVINTGQFLLCEYE